MVYFPGSDGEFNTKCVFALDYSSSVSDNDFRTQFTFVKDITECWKFPPENSKVALVRYGDDAKPIPHNPNDNSFSVQLSEQEARTRVQSKRRRMDLALIEAADNFEGSPFQHQLVVLITAGRQYSGAESKEEDHELLVSASETLSSRNIKLIIVPVGLETDFRELGLIVKRPQSLFPLSSFDDMTPGTAQNMASNIRKTIGEIILFGKTCIPIVILYSQHQEKQTSDTFAHIYPPISSLIVFFNVFLNTIIIAVQF